MHTFLLNDNKKTCINGLILLSLHHIKITIKIIIIMSQAIALEKIKDWKEGTPLNLNNLGLTEIPKEIATLTNLTYLFLYNNKITDVSPLASLSNLTWLELDKNKIKNLKPIASLTKLNDLYLDHNIITDVSPLSSLTNLKHLHLNSNIITDVTPLASLTNCKVHY
jgi:internalin A